MGRLLSAYRRAGSDLPFADPARGHGAALEGYYWRIVDAAAGRVVVVLCGVCRHPHGPWATVAVAGHPGLFLRHAEVTPAATDGGRFGVTAGTLLDAGLERLTVHLADDTRLDVRLRVRTGRPGRAFGALGPAHAVPGLSQYWHPVVLDAAVEGEARLGDETLHLDGASAYVEKNWGGAFPPRWWWGHAGSFPGADATVAFAGGPVALGRVRVQGTAVVARVGDRILRFAPPGALVRARAGDGGWRVTARSARHVLRLEGDGSEPHLLPVPDPAQRRVRMRSRQHLAGRMSVELIEGRRLLLRAQSELAGLELGQAVDLSPVRRAAPPP